ncbi:hypothetical protein L9F63_027678, partial [Diploptera punctata]
WFPGWAQHNHYNRQPNDDGLSEQDCVELRRVYHLPSSNERLAHSFIVERQGLLDAQPLLVRETTYR